MPEQWCTQVRNTLNSSYAVECKKHKRSFDVHGETHPDEVVIAISFLDPEHPTAIPVTYFVSADLAGSAPAQKILDALVDSAGIFFDQYFATPDWNEYFGDWTEGEIRNVDFFYLVNRDNVRLSLMADELLGNLDDE